MHRVWITGRGVMSPLGSTPDDLADALEQRRSGVRLLPGSAAMGITPYTCVGASIGADPCSTDIADPQWPAALLALLDRNAMLGLRAAQSAWLDAGLAEVSLDPERAALAWGCGMGGATTAENSYADLYASSPRRLHPYVVVRTMNNAAAAHIAMRHHLQGPLLAVSNACASAAQAIGEGMHWVRSGRADVVVVGGSEALLVPGVIRAWQAMGVLARTDLERPEASCRPFDRRRNGLVLGEGAGALVLESEAHARARGAKPLAELAGYGSSCDAAHLSRPDQAGQVRAMRQALTDAGLAPERIGHVNAHGTGTPVGDAVEARSIHEVFGAEGPRPAVAATKALHGHLMGASGAVELIAGLEALRRGRLPPSAHVNDSDCLAWIDLIEGEARHVAVEAVMSNSFAFGGANVSLVVRHADA